MKLYKLLTVTLLLAILSSASCSNASVKPSSSAGALTANSALDNFAARPFGRHHLNVSGFNTLNEFLRPEVRARMDEEPVGDADTSYDPGTLDPEASREEAPSEPAADVPNDEPQFNQSNDEDNLPNAARLDSVKFSWAKKSFAEAVKADLNAIGVVVLYADENLYDMTGLMGHIEHGRDRLAEQSSIGGERIQVVFGGFRAVPQVELWIVPAGSMPELKPEDRSKSSGPEN